MPIVSLLRKNLKFLGFRCDLSKCNVTKQRQRNAFEVLSGCWVFKTIQISVSDNNELTNDWQLQAQLELELELATMR